MNIYTLFYFIGFCMRIVSNFVLSITRYGYQNPLTRYTMINKGYLTEPYKGKGHCQDKNQLINLHKDKKIIAISPGGYKGFYLMGVCHYIKSHYKLDNYVFSGASAGSWNSLMMCYRGDTSNICNLLLKTCAQPIKTIFDLEMRMKRDILSHFRSEDFDLDKLNIGITTMTHGTIIFSDFEHLEDALDGCIASSHIPVISGKLTHTYRGLLAFDGGFSENPYLLFDKPVLHITPGMWKPKPSYINPVRQISAYTTLWSKDSYNFKELFDEGYRHAEEHKEELDRRLLH